MIEVNSISFRYHQDWVLQDVSFRVEKGEFIGVIGPNGSGKSNVADAKPTGWKSTAPGMPRIELVGTPV